MKKNEINICIQNLGMYNEGRLLFKWISLPTDRPFSEHLKDIKVEYNTQYEEYMIADYECEFMEVSIYDSLDNINEIAEKVIDFTDDQINAIQVLIDERGMEIDCAIDNAKEVEVYDISTTEDLGKELFGDYNPDTPHYILQYIDYEKFGQEQLDSGDYALHENKIYYIGGL